MYCQATRATHYNLYSHEHHTTRFKFNRYACRQRGGIRVGVPPSYKKHNVECNLASEYPPKSHEALKRQYQWKYPTMFADFSPLFRSRVVLSRHSIRVRWDTNSKSNTFRHTWGIPKDISLGRCIDTCQLGLKIQVQRKKSRYYLYSFRCSSETVSTTETTTVELMQSQYCKRQL